MCLVRPHCHCSSLEFHVMKLRYLLHKVYEANICSLHLGPQSTFWAMYFELLIPKALAHEAGIFNLTACRKEYQALQQYAIVYKNVHDMRAYSSQNHGPKQKTHFTGCSPAARRFKMTMLPLPRVRPAIGDLQSCALIRNCQSTYICPHTCCTCCASYFQFLKTLATLSP